MHFREKKEQSFKKEDVKEVISTLQAIVKQQQMMKLEQSMVAVPIVLVVHTKNLK